MTFQFGTAEGERIYAIGDVHGCWSLLTRCLAAIRRDNEAREPAVTRIVLLGDVVDRGPAPAEVVAALMRYTRSSDRFVVLMGNHEQVMWSALNGDEEALGAWLAMGGSESLHSWGVDEGMIKAGDPRRLLKLARSKIGPDVALWLERRPLTLMSGDLLFVHAGVRPELPLSAQTPSDLLWIRSPFLESDEDRPFLTIHGHTISPDGPVVRPNRIGLDTGAFCTGRLTAMGFEGRQRWELRPGPAASNDQDRAATSALRARPIEHPQGSAADASKAVTSIASFRERVVPVADRLRFGHACDGL